MKTNILILVMLFSLWGCKKEIKVNSYSQKENPKTLGACICTPPQEGVSAPCGAQKVQCMKNFFNNGGFSRTYVVEWCGTNTIITMCYNNNCKMMIQFKSVPACLNCCIQENVCYEGEPACGNHSMNITFNSTDCRGVSMSITISGDPKISVTCIDVQGNPFTVDGIMS